MRDTKTAHYTFREAKNAKQLALYHHSLCV